MACTITSGRTEPCLDAISGIKAMYIIPFVEDSFTVSGGEATGLDVAVTECFKYNLNADGNTFGQPSTTSKETGVTTYEQAGAAILKKVDKATTNELSIVVKNQPVIVWQFRNGDYKVQGIEDGCIVTVDEQSGGSKADFNGYNVTTTSTTVSPAPTLDAATVTALLAIVSATNINP
jgi:hypothetical protein